MIIISPKWKVTEQDLEKIVHNAALFGSLAAVVFLTQIQMGKSFKEAADVFWWWLLGVVVDALRKWGSDRTYIK